MQAKSTTHVNALMWEEALYIQGTQQVQCGWRTDNKRSPGHDKFCIHCIIYRVL